MVYFTVGIIYEFGMFGEGQNCYYHLHTLDALATLCSSVGVFGIYYLILNYLPHWAIRVIESISRNINTTYSIHWIIISFVVNVGLYILRGTQVLSVPMTMLLGTTISVISILMAYGWTAVKKRYFGGKSVKHSSKLSRKLSIGYLCFSVMLIVCICFVVGFRYWNSRMNEYSQLAYCYTRTAADYIDGDKVLEYVESGQKDDYYQKVMEFLTITRVCF